MDLLLLSNSTNHGRRMFAHAADAFAEVAAGSTVTFIPFALAEWDDYAYRAEAAFGAFGIEVVSAHRADDPARPILEAEVVMMGGGNTFRLLDTLVGLGVLEGLSARVRAGETRYLGASAGTNVACPTIRTTNDMPICRPPPSTPSAWCRSRSTSTTSTPTRRRPSWARPARSASRSSSRRTTAPCWPCTRARGCGCRRGGRR